MGKCCIYYIDKCLTCIFEINFPLGFLNNVFRVFVSKE